MSDKPYIVRDMLANRPAPRPEPTPEQLRLMAESAHGSLALAGVRITDEEFERWTQEVDARRGGRPPLNRNWRTQPGTDGSTDE